MSTYYGQEKKYNNPPNECGISHPMNLAEALTEMAQGKGQNDNRILKEAACLLEDYFIYSEYQKKKLS